MRKGINELYKLYKIGALRWDEEIDLMNQLNKLGFKIYNKYGVGEDNPIDEDDAQSIINLTITRCLQNYDINNSSKTKFSSYFAEAVNLNLLQDIRNNNKEARKRPDDLLELDKEIEGKERGMSYSDVIGKVEDLTEFESLSFLWSRLWDETIYAHKGIVTDEVIQRKNKLYEQRKSIIMMRIEGYSLKEIEDMLGKDVSQATIVRTLSLARDILGEIVNYN